MQKVNFCNVGNSEGNDRDVWAGGVWWEVRWGR